MENLISTTDFNIQLFERLFTDQIGDASYVDKVVRYAKIMKQPIRKNMFVPCLPDGDIFQTPTPCSKSCSPIDYCVGGKCDIEGCYGDVVRYEEACKTVVFDGWFGFTNSLSKAETGIANEVTNGEFTIYFKKEGLPLLVNEREGAFTGIPVKTIEDLLKSEATFKLSDNFKRQIKL
jgi:hypothetical protein